MVLKVRYEKLGGHYHMALFTAREMNQTFAKIGDLVGDERDFQLLQSLEPTFGTDKVVFEERI